MRAKKWMLAVFIMPCMLLFMLIYLAPMVMVFITSFFDWKAGGVFSFVGLENYVQGFLHDPRMIQSGKNTFIWAFLQSTVHVTIGTVLAFMLSRKRKGWKALRTIFMIPNVVSAAALGVIFLNVFNAKYGLINSFFSVVTGSPFTKNWYFEQSSAFVTTTLSWLLYTGMIVILVLAGIMSIPEELIEAAKIDGASTWIIDTKIRLPLVRSILGTSVILAATSMLREFELIYLTTNGGPGTTTLNLPLYLYKTSLTDNNYGYANMMGVVLIIVGVAVVYGINKLFRMNEAN